MRQLGTAADAAASAAAALFGGAALSRTRSGATHELVLSSATGRFSYPTAAYRIQLGREPAAALRWPAAIRRLLTADCGSFTLLELSREHAAAREDRRPGVPPSRRPTGQQLPRGSTSPSWQQMPCADEDPCRCCRQRL